MSLLHLARRLLCVSALIMFAAIAVSVMTHDAWLTAGHVAGMVSALIAAVAVLASVVAGLRGIARWRSPGRPDDGELAPYEQGLTGLDRATDSARRSALDAPSDR